MKRKIVRSVDLERISHRAGITNCPHCDFDKQDSDPWAKNAIVLMLDTAYGKHGSVVVVSECPKCCKKSWVHQPFSFFNDWSDHYPEDWKAAAQAEFTRRHCEAVSRFADSLCAKCQHLRRLECETLPIVSCTYGAPVGEDADTWRTATGRWSPPIADRKAYLHSCFTETECPKFKPRHP